MHRLTQVTAEPDMPILEAYVDPNDRWNGWIVPKMTQEQTEALADTLGSSLGWTLVVGNQLLLTELDTGTVTIDAETIIVDGEEIAVYGVGFGICWTEVQPFGLCWDLEGRFAKLP